MCGAPMQYLADAHYAAALVSLQVAQILQFRAFPGPGLVDYTLYTTREGRAEGESADRYSAHARGIAAQAWRLDGSAAGHDGGQCLSYGAAVLGAAR